MTAAVEGELSDAEWIAEVRKYALNFGGYDFSPSECRRLQPYASSRYPSLRMAIASHQVWHVPMVMAFDLMHFVECGLIDAVTRKLTQ